MRTAMSASEDVHAALWRPMHLGYLAEAHASIGEHAQALELLDVAIALATSTKECHFEAELHRLRGEILLPHDSRGAQACFERALSVGRQQHAKLWELRAATSLARLWGDQGRRGVGKNLLEPIYGWFTEGFDMPDLRAARDLLEDLGRQS